MFVATALALQITLELLGAINRNEKKHQIALFLPLQRIDNSIIYSVHVSSTFAALSMATTVPECGIEGNA